MGTVSVIVFVNQFLNFSIVASELRAWLLYYSLPVLKGILPDDYYCHFALLSTSIYLLLQQPVTQQNLILADRQLEEFYCRLEDYYGKSNCL
jgi:hypothetical protein